MSHHNEANGSLSSMFIGFILAITNHMFGWFNVILQVKGTHINEWLQAFITGSIGAIGAFLMNKLLKIVDKKIKTRKEKNEHR
jgi:hypothetical protein